MHVKHAAIFKLKHAALFLIMQLVLGLILLRVSMMLRVDLARVRLPLIIFLLPKKTAPVFLTQLVCIIFLSTFGDIIADRKQWVWMTISNYVDVQTSRFLLFGFTRHDFKKCLEN